MDIRKSFRRFRQFGGFRLLSEYARLGLLWPIFKKACACLVRRRSFKEIYPVIEAKVVPALFRKYGGFIKGRMEYYAANQVVATVNAPRRIWVLWLQGFDKAPALVKACLASIRRNMPASEIVCLDASNLRQWMELPRNIEEKFARGIIPPAMYSDIIRLELLVKYGGIYLDASVFLSEALPRDIVEAPLFIPRYEKADGSFGGIGSWMMSAAAGNASLAVLRDTLVKYWEDYDCAMDYYAIHRFFSLIAAHTDGLVASMPRHCCVPALKLNQSLNLPFDPLRWEVILAGSSFHKLSPRVEVKSGTFADYLINL